MRRTILFVGVVALVLSFAAQPASASPPLAVHIESGMVFPAEGPSTGDFFATGPAVDAGVLCENGDVVDLAVLAADGQSGFQGLLVVWKEMTCADGSGAFLLLLRVRLTLDPETGESLGDVASWSVLRGTGSYAKLHGTGSLVGTPTGPGVFDVYEGAVHTD